MRYPQLATLLLLTFASMYAPAQWQGAQWVFGYQSAIDFTCSPPRGYNSGVHSYFTEGSASIADESGKLQFSTDGHNVYNRNFQLMVGGRDIGVDTNCWGSSTQGALIVPQPGHDSLYYIFTADCAENLLANGINYSIVNMNRQGGLGEVVVQRQPLITKGTEKLCAVHHQNDNAIWIVAHEWGNNKWYAYLLSNTGLAAPVISPTGRISQAPYVQTGIDPECAARGQARFSPTGDRLVAFYTSDCHGWVANPELYHFDNATGVLTYDYELPIGNGFVAYGGTFSPDGSLLYMSSAWYDCVLRQYDLSSNQPTTIVSSLYTLDTDPGCANGYQFGSPQIAPDGKIYVACNNQTFLPTISNPNVYGPGCGYQLHGYELYPCSYYASYGLPNLVESWFINPFNIPTCTSLPWADFSITDSCAGAPVQLRFIPLMDSSLFHGYRWTFGNGGTSIYPNTVAFYSNPGTYTVQLVVYADGARQCPLDTITHTVTIVNCATAVDEAGPSISILPQPATDHVRILSPRPVIRARLYDVQGRLLHAEQGPNITELSTPYPDGIYLLQLWTEDNLLLQRKLVIGQ